MKVVYPKSDRTLKKIIHSQIDFILLKKPHMKKNLQNLLKLAVVLISIPVSAQVMPQLPQYYLNSCVPTTTITKTVCASGCDYNNTELQQAIDDALPGTTITLEAGFTYNGQFSLPEKSGTGAIIIRTSTADANLPDEDTRIDPSYSNVLAKLQGPAYSAVLTTDSRAHNYFFLGIEFLLNGAGYDIITIGNGETTINDLPHDITFDRVYIHGHPTLGVKRGITANGKNIAIVNSYISDCKVEGQDAQAICAWSGTGFKIVNNFLEGSGENVMFGGADANITNLNCSDIEFRNNHVYKPVAWFTNNLQWCVKNLFELKNATRVLIEGNIFENNWGDCQSGASILFTVRNQDGGNTWAQVADVTFRKNIVRHVASGFNILGTDDIYPSQQTVRISITDNVFEDINGSKWNGGGRVFQVLSGVDHLTIEHNTVLNDSAVTFITVDGTPSNYNFIFRNNIVSHALYGVHGSGYGVGNSSINQFFPGCIFTNNLMTDGAVPTQYPANNFYEPNLPAVGFVNYNNGVGGDYHLTSSSLYNNLGTDGKDLGANIDSVYLRTKDVESGLYVSCHNILSNINELKNDSPVTIYPNPTNGSFILSANNSSLHTIEVFSVVGELVKTVALPASVSSSIDLSGLPDGTYIVKIKGEEDFFVQKIILQK